MSGLRSEYINAIETRLRWLKWCKTDKARIEFARNKMTQIMQTYERILEHGDTFYMAPHFCDMVDHARLTVPDDLRFDAKWLQSKRGFLFCSTPFMVPESVILKADPSFKDWPADQQIALRAIGWQEIPEGEWITPMNAPSYKAEPGTIQFCAMVDDTSPFSLIMTDDGHPLLDLDASGEARAQRIWEERRTRYGQGTFSPWAYFVLRNGDRLGDRIKEFEEKGRAENPEGAYVDSDRRRADQLHEIRWIFTGLYLMAQRFSATVRHQTDRALRRRAERDGQVPPTYIQVITLRRLEEERPKTEAQDKDWKWQWIVRGHWRNQYYPSENVHRPVYIEAFVKGPSDMPMKPSSIRIFAAER